MANYRFLRLHLKMKRLVLLICGQFQVHMSLLDIHKDFKAVGLQFLVVNNQRRNCNKFCPMPFH